MSDLPLGQWRKSSTSEGGDCVEVAQIRDGIGVRDSKDPDGPVLRFNRREWMVFLQGAKKGEFDEL